MADGYTRQRSSEIVNGNVIDADDFDVEFNAVAGAMNASTGHNHDGTSGGGAPIESIGPAQDLVVTSTNVNPKTTNTLSLGAAGAQYKDAFFDGTVQTDLLLVDETSIFTGAITANGGITGNLTGDVTGDLTGNADTATTWETAREIALTGDVTGSVTGVDGSGNISITTTVAENSVALGTDTSGNYMTDVSAGTGVTVTHTPNEGSTATVAIGQAVGTTDNVTFNTVTANLTGNVTGNVTGNADTATTLATARTIAGQSFNGSADITIAATDLSDTNQALSTTSDVTFNDVTVSGDLTVSGTTTTVNTETINLADNQIVLNSNEAGTPTQNGGIEIERGTEANKTLVWDETADKWTVGGETFVASTFEGNLTGNVTGNLTGDTIGTHTGAVNATSIVVTGVVTGNVTGDLFGNVSQTGDFTLDTSGDIILDSDTGNIVFKDGGVTQGSISFVDGLNTSNLVSFYAGTTKKLEIKPVLTTVYGNFDTTGNITSDGNITADGNSFASDVYSSSDIYMTAGASDWKFTVNASNELVISYGGVNKMKLDSSGNLTVTGNVTAYGTV